MVYFRGRRATLFGNVKTLERVHGFRRFHVSPWILIFKAFIIALLFLLATGSLEVFQQKSAVNTDYVILLDSSSSMAQTDFPPNRLSAAKQISTNWLNAIPEFTQIGYVSFTTGVETHLPLTLDHTSVKERIRQTDINYGAGGTSLDFAVNFGMDLFSPDHNRNKTMILLTDAADDVAQTTLANAKSRGIRIFAFGIGKEQEAPVIDDTSIPEDLIDSFSRLDFNFTKLELVANATDGKAFQIQNTSDLQSAFEEATLSEIQLELNSGYYVLLLIALMSIVEFLLYAKVGGI